jgi:hypothetical protein
MLQQKRTGGIALQAAAGLRAKVSQVSACDARDVPAVAMAFPIHIIGAWAWNSLDNQQSTKALTCVFSAFH